MADMKDWGVTASDNNVASPDGAQTGWVGADAGPWARESMAAVARWHADPSWVNFMRYGLTPTGNKTVSRSGDLQVEIAATGSWASATTDVFSPGRLIRLKETGGDYHYGFITASSIATTVLTVDLAMLGEAIIPNPTTFDTNGVEFYIGYDTVDTTTAGPRILQALSAMSFGGSGTETERNTKFPSAANMPQGILWANDTSGHLEMIAGSAGSRAWITIAPLYSIWSDSGGDLTLISSAQSKVTINSATSNPSAVILQENSVVKSRYLYEPAAGRSVFEGGDTTGTAGRVYIYDSDGKAYYQAYSGGTPGTLQNMTPGEIDAGSVGGVDAVVQNAMPRARTGTGGLIVGAYTTWELIHSGALPAAIEALLEDSGWDEMEMIVDVVFSSVFGGSPSSGGLWTFNLFLGDDLHITPPGDLSTGEVYQFSHTHAGVNPIVYRETANIFNADLSGNINSFAIALSISAVGNPQDVTWENNDGGNNYSAISFGRGYRVVT